jgi:RNA polymerase sigma factor (sigma-70 family)
MLARRSTQAMDLDFGDGFGADEGTTANPGTEALSPLPPTGICDDADGMRLLEIHMSAVCRFVAQRVSNPADAADISQETMRVASTKLETLRSRNPRNWLLGIARHLILDHYRAQNRFEWLELDTTAQKETEPALRTAQDVVPELCDCRESLRCWLHRLIQRLRPVEQVAVLLADVHGYRDKDSASLLHVSVPSFKLLLHDARAHLRDISQGRCTLVADAPKELSRGAIVRDSRRETSKRDNVKSGSQGTRPALRVICRLTQMELLKLRGKLLESLNPFCTEPGCALQDVLPVRSSLRWGIDPGTDRQAEPLLPAASAVPRTSAAGPAFDNQLSF